MWLLRLAPIAVALAILGSALLNVWRPDDTIAFWALLIFLALISSHNVWMTVMWRRRIRYGDNLDTINEGFKEIHEVMRNGELSKDSLIRACERLCSKVAKTMSVITGRPCSACIKILTHDIRQKGLKEKLIETLARDNESREREERYRDNDYAHHIANNTHFYHIVRMGKECFLTNYLPWRQDYNNSRFESVGYPEGLKPLRPWSYFVRLKRWPLCYKSILVVPIRGPRGDDGKPRNLGFLCVDSSRLGVFRKKHDVQLLRGIADGVYNVVLRIWLDMEV